jgi:hypothetical protein
MMLHSGRFIRLRVLSREVLSESFSSPSSDRNQISVNCGNPSPPIVASVATWASSRSR